MREKEHTALIRVYQHRPMCGPDVYGAYCLGCSWQGVLRHDYNEAEDDCLVHMITKKERVR